MFALHYDGVVTAVGLVTLCFAAFIAIFKHDLKGLLAYSTLSHLGLIVCLLGIGSPLAVAAALFHVLNHATFKAALFMLAGVIDHQTGTRNLRKLGGLWTLLPWTATLSMVAAAAMGGIPLTNGFLSKEMFLTEVLTLTGGTWLLIVPLLATLGALFGITYSIRFVHNTFFGGVASPRLPNKNIKEASLGLRSPIILLCILCIAVGLLPAFFAQSIVQLGAGAVLNYTPVQPVHLAIWHGFNMPLVMSLIAIIGGALLYMVLAKNQKIQHIHSEQWFGNYAGDDLFERVLVRCVASARKLISTLENGSLQRYLVFIITATLVMAIVPLWGEQLRTGSRLLN
ncbi:MAG: monovalent cation/H+ antiporter subunit A, partial [Moraxellaceae bacterium]